MILLPGGVLPAEPAYAALIEALGEDVHAVTQDLEVYASDEPPDDYSLDLEIAGVVREADMRGWERFHLAGYSAGGASALAFAARHGERLVSLALLEPAWAGNWDLSSAEAALWQEYERLESLPDDRYMAAFAQTQLREGVEPPPRPPGEPPSVDGEAPCRPP